MKLEDQIEQLDLEEDPQNFLKLEDYDMNQVNEYQRQLNSHFDYEKLNNKTLAPVDEQVIKDQFLKDSVQNKETVIKMMDQSEKDIDWQNIKYEEESKNADYERILDVNPSNEEEQELYKKLKTKTEDIKI